MDLVKSLDSFSSWVLKASSIRFRAQPDSIDSIIRQAAKSKRKIYLRYSKSGKRRGGGVYLVAPYSFRQKPSGTVLFAYDFGDRKTKSFLLSNITGVSLTDNKFRAKWSVEIGDDA